MHLSRDVSFLPLFDCLFSDSCPKALLAVRGLAAPAELPPAARGMLTSSTEEFVELPATGRAMPAALPALAGKPPPTPICRCGLDIEPLVHLMRLLLLLELGDLAAPLLALTIHNAHWLTSERTPGRCSSMAGAPTTQTLALLWAHQRTAPFST